MSRRQIIGPIFFIQTITAKRYRNDIITPFINELSEEEKTNDYFQQGVATAHTTHSSLYYLSDVFQARFISKRLWPSISPDLNLLDFCLWVALKQKVHRNKPRTLQKLYDNIRHQINAISQKKIPEYLRT